MEGDKSLEAYKYLSVNQPSVQKAMTLLLCNKGDYLLSYVYSFKHNTESEESDSEPDTTSRTFSQPLNRVGIAARFLVWLDLQRDYLSLDILEDILDDYDILTKELENNSEIDESEKADRLKTLESERKMFASWEEHTIKMSQAESITDKVQNRMATSECSIM